MFPSISWMQKKEKKIRDMWRWKPPHISSRMVMPKKLVIMLCDVQQYRQFVPVIEPLEINQGSFEQKKSHRLENHLNNGMCRYLNSGLTGHISHQFLRAGDSTQQLKRTHKHQMSKGKRETMEDIFLTILSNGVSLCIPKCIRDEAIGDFLELHEDMQVSEVNAIKRLFITFIRFLSLLPAGVMIHASQLFPLKGSCFWPHSHRLGSSQFFGGLLMACLSLTGSILH